MVGSVVHDPVVARTSKPYFSSVDRDRQVLVNLGEAVVEFTPWEPFAGLGSGFRDAVGISAMDRTRGEGDRIGSTKPRMPTDLNGHVVLGVNRESKFESVGVEQHVMRDAPGERPRLRERRRHHTRGRVAVIDAPCGVVNGAVKGVRRTQPGKQMGRTVPLENSMTKATGERNHGVEAPVEWIVVSRITGDDRVDTVHLEA